MGQKKSFKKSNRNQRAGKFSQATNTGSHFLKPIGKDLRSIPIHPRKTRPDKNVSNPPHNIE